MLKNDPRVITVSSGGMYNVAFPDWEQATSQKENIIFDGQLAYAYAKRGQVILMEEMSKMYNDIKFVSCHPGWVDTPGVESAYGSKKKYLEPLRSLWQGAEGICWLAVIPGERLVPGAFYLDRKPQQKHITGTFNSDGGFTRNTSD